MSDLREAQEIHGKGRVADAAGVHSKQQDVDSRAGPALDDDPTADDPYGMPSHSAAVVQLQDDPGPAYERGQGNADPSTGGSTDPHNSMTHANSGDETEMPDQVDNQITTKEAVDGFSDTKGDTSVSSPDPGENKKADPLDPDEYAEAQREARAEDDQEDS